MQARQVPEGRSPRRLRAPLLVLLLACAPLCLARCGAQIGGAGPDDEFGDGGAGDGDGGLPADNGPRRLVGLRISPDNDVLLVDLKMPGSRAFKVDGVFSDRSTEDYTGKVTLTADNAAAGQLAGATFQAAVSNANKVEFTRVTATWKEGEQTLTGLANLTIIWLRQSGPSQDFFFSLPYNGPDQKKPLSFTTLIQSLDSFFAVDTTGSMGPSIAQLSGSLQNTIIPGVKAAAARDAWFGVGAVEDFPVDPYGKPNYRGGMPDDQAFLLLGAMAADVNVAKGAVGALLVGAEPRGNGADLPEGQMEALYQIATGAGNVRAGVSNIPANRTGIGGVGFRDGALPVITAITDALFHTKGEPARQCTARTTLGGAVSIPAEYGGATAAAAHTRAETLTELNKICAKVIGVSTLRTSISGAIDDPAGICNATDDLVQLANGTGALVPPEAWDVPGRPAGCGAGTCCTGLGGAGESPNGQGLCPLVFKIGQTGSGLGAQVTSGITQLARFATFDVVAQTSGVATGEKGETLPMGKTTADFIKGVLPLDAMAPPPPPVVKAPVIQGDHFTGVTPGSLVRFNIDARNDFQMSTQVPQIFHATIKIRAGGCADLDQRDVIILIPPVNPNIG